MSTCKDCGAVIDWVRTMEAGFIPVDPEPVFIIEDGGADRFVDDEGQILKGRLALPEEERRDLTVAFVPHRKTCTAADSSRRR